MKRINQLAALALTLVVAGGTLSATEAQRRGRLNVRTVQLDENADGISDGQALRHRHGGPKLGQDGLRAQLSSEQQAELHEQIGALRESGAAAEEISAALAAELTAAGIELPADFAERAAQRETQRAERTAQREEIKTLVDGLKADGATRQEIRQALQAAGYEQPHRGRRGGYQGGIKPTETPAAE